MKGFSYCFPIRGTLFLTCQNKIRTFPGGTHRVEVFSSQWVKERETLRNVTAT